MPEDNITITCGVEYREYDEHDPLTQRLEDILHMIFPEDDIYEYFMAILASCMRGVNFRQEM